MDKNILNTYIYITKSQIKKLNQIGQKNQIKKSINYSILQNSSLKTTISVCSILEHTELTVMNQSFISIKYKNKKYIQSHTKKPSYNHNFFIFFSW